MILAEHEIKRVIKHVKTSFPNFSNWKYNNEKNEDYFGFSIWGEYTPNPEKNMPRYFFVTIDAYEKNWQGHLTVGLPSYFWSSADVGDAYLLGTKPCMTVEEAISALKKECEGLFEAFSA